MGLGRLCQITKQDALHDLCAMLVDHAHMGGGAYAHFAEQRYGVFTRKIELFCEFVNAYCCCHSFLISVSRDR